MKLFISFFIFLIFISFSSAQNKYLVFFTDKGFEESGQLSKDSYYFQLAESQLSERSIERRKKVMGDNGYVKYEDIPLRALYLNIIEDLGINIVHKLKWFNAISCKLKYDQVRQVSKLPFVKKIQKVKKLKGNVRNFNTGIGSLEKPSKEDTNDYLYDYGPSFGQYMMNDIPPVHNLEISGEGVIVGLLDAGFKKSHEAFSNMNIIAEWDFVYNDSSTANEPWEDPYAEGHGTFTLSLIGAFSEGNMVAPVFGSDFVLAKTENVDIESHIEEDNFAAALEWMDSIGVDITSSSIGYSLFDDSTYSYTYEDMDGQTTIVSIASNLAFERGMINFTSAGNEGWTSWFYITAPADAFKIISVGAVNDQGQYTSWHSRGPTYDGRLKPEICAQGEGYGISAEASGGFSISTGIWGTSGSCPIAAGVSGMLLSTFHHLTNEQVRSIILQSGSNLLQPDNIRGYGILSAATAITFPNLIYLNGLPKLNKIFLNYDNMLPGTETIHFSIGEGKYFTESLTNDTGYVYNFVFPQLFTPDTIKFFFTYIDSSGEEHRDPAESFYKFYYGDLIVEFDISNLSNNSDYSEIVRDYNLYQNYPNPFNPTTKIKFTIPLNVKREMLNVTLKVYDILGNEIATLVNEEKPAGSYEVEFNATSHSGEVRNLPSGVYFYRLQAVDPGSSSGQVFVKTKKMVLLR
jgi:hypothetical protein